MWLALSVLDYPLTTVAKIATAENLPEVNAQIKAGRLRVALPIFGVKQKLSQGIMGQIEQEVLEQEGIEMENLRFNELSRARRKRWFAHGYYSSQRF